MAPETRLRRLLMVLAFVVVAGVVVIAVQAYMTVDLTSEEIINRSRSAYRTLRSYEGHTEATLVSYGLHKYRSSADVAYQAPDKLHVKAALGDGGTWEAIANTQGAWTRAGEPYGPARWKRPVVPGVAVGGAGDMYSVAATTIPPLLMKKTWGDPYTDIENLLENPVRVLLRGRPVYRVKAEKSNGDMVYWIDTKTFMLVQRHERSGVYLNSKEPPASEKTECFSRIKINHQVPANLFDTPSDR